MVPDTLELNAEVSKNEYKRNRVLVVAVLVVASNTRTLRSHFCPRSAVFPRSIFPRFPPCVSFLRWVKHGRAFLSFHALAHLDNALRRIVAIKDLQQFLDTLSVVGVLVCRCGPCPSLRSV
jgi:hypothetical protein